MAKTFLIIGAFMGGLSVALGAFGAHALKTTLEYYQRVETFELASRYQFYHALAILAVGLILFRYDLYWIHYAGYAFLLGILIFSGSLYVLSVTGQNWLGAVTPIGGLFLIIGWGLLVLGIMQIKV